VAAQRLQGQPLIGGALRGMGVVAAGLVLSTALRLVGALRSSARGVRWCGVLLVATAAAIGGLRWPLAWVVLGLGAFAVALAWHRLPR
jgi:chromate transporter